MQERLTCCYWTSRGWWSLPDWPVTGRMGERQGTGRDLIEFQWAQTARRLVAWRRRWRGGRRQQTERAAWRRACQVAGEWMMETMDTQRVPALPVARAVSAGREVACNAYHQRRSQERRRTDDGLPWFGAPFVGPTSPA